MPIYSKGVGSGLNSAKSENRARRIASHKCPVIKRMKLVMATRDRPANIQEGIVQLIAGINHMPEADATLEILREIRRLDEPQ